MKIKKLITILLAMLMILSLAACGGGASEDSSADAAADTEVSEEAADETDASANSGDILIVYFSAANRTDTDATTSATPTIDGEGATGWMANVIQEKTGADIVKIIPAEDYPLSYDDVADAAKKEADNEVHPAIQPLDVDPTAYKTVFIGYPMWWYRMPMVLETFFDTYDFSGVTIVPFNTHEGSRDGGTYDMIRDREPNATVLDGIAIRGGNAGEDSAKDDIEEWLDGLDLE